MTHDSLERQKRRERFIVRFMMEPPTAMYDIGVGPKSEWITLQEIFPQMEVCGVEPNPQMVEQIISDGWRGKLLQNVIHPSRGEMKLRVYREDGLNAGLFEFASRAPSKEYAVPAITLDDADEKFGCLDGILLWMDIEGAELMALESGPKLMSSGRVKWLNLEVRNIVPWVGGCTANEVDQYLTQMNYRKVADYNVHDNVGHWDTIYCHNDVSVNPYPKPNHVPNLSK